MIKVWTFFKHSEDILLDKLFIKTTENAIQTIAFSMRFGKGKEDFLILSYLLLKQIFCLSINNKISKKTLLGFSVEPMDFLGVVSKTKSLKSALKIPLFFFLFRNVTLLDEPYIYYRHLTLKVRFNFWFEYFNNLNALTSNQALSCIYDTLMHMELKSWMCFLQLQLWNTLTAKNKNLKIGMNEDSFVCSLRQHYVLCQSLLDFNYFSYILDKDALAPIFGSFITIKYMYNIEKYKKYLYISYIFSTNIRYNTKIQNQWRVYIK